MPRVFNYSTTKEIYMNRQMDKYRPMHSMLLLCQAPMANKRLQATTNNYKWYIAQTQSLAAISVSSSQRLEGNIKD